MTTFSRPASHWRILCAVCAGAAAMAGAQPAPALERVIADPPPGHSIKRTTKSIVVDGRMDDAAWADATPVTLQFPWEAQTGAKQRTTVRLLWSDEFLFVAFHCEDNDVVAQYEQRDDPTYKDDAVEIFLQPNPKLPIYIGLEMNARGVLYDYLYLHPHQLVKGFDLKGVQLASHIDGTLNLTSDQDKGWTLEVAIPLRNFTEFNGGRPITAGIAWSGNLNRWDGTEPHRRLSVWSDTAMVRPNPHNPKRFGRLEFAP